jgi:multidrug transporter EmrE-like cation transporter
MRPEHGVLLLATVCAAVGQLLFKVGAGGRSDWRQMVNLPIAGGLLCYALGTLGWIFALSKLPLRVVYPYTALTFVLVYAGAIGFLGEKVDLRAFCGVGLVLAGLFLLTVEVA